MENTQFTQLSAFPGWIVGVCHTHNIGYQCWVIDANLRVLNDGYHYSTSSAALMAGRSFVERQQGT